MSRTRAQRTRGWASLLTVSAIACAPSAPPAHTPEPQLGWMRGELLVRLDPGLDALDAERIAARAGAWAAERSGVPGWWRLSIDPRADAPTEAAAIALASGVSVAQPNRLRALDRTPNDQRFGEQFSHTLTHAERGWSVEVGDPSVVVAVIGSGVSLEHQDLSPNIFTNGREIPNDLLDNDLNGFVDDIHGWDFLSGDNDPNPVIPPNASVGDRQEASHETFAAGVVGAVGNNNVGIAGVAWDVSLLPIRFDYTSAGSADAMIYATNLGADIITMSYGSVVDGEDGRDPIESDAVDFAAAAGVVLVASAGNDDTDLFHFPAAFDEVIAVAASDRDDRRADFSNYGYWVDVTAPGVDVLSTFYGGGYTVSSGTSFSAPYVAGLAALLRAAHPTWTRQEIRNTIEFTGEKLFPDHYIGTRVDVGRALDAITPAQAFARIIEPFSTVRHPGNAPLPLSGIAIGDSYVIEIQRAGGTEWTTVGGGTMPVDNGPLGTIDTTGLVPGDYRLRLTAQAGNATDVDWLSVTIVQSTLPGWPVAVDAVATAPVVVGDVTGDGQPEVIACLLRGDVATLEVFDARGRMLPGWPRVLPAPLALPPVMGDLDGDGRADIVVASGDTLLSFDGAGQTVTVFPAGILTLSGLALGDLDGDGTPEVVAAERQGRLWAITARGVAIPGWPIVVEPGLGPLVVADLDANGLAEIAVVGERRLHLFDGGRRMLIGMPVFVDGVREAALIATDTDGDGRSELFVGRDFNVMAMDRFSRGVRRVYGIGLDGERLIGWPMELERNRSLVTVRTTVVPLVAADVDGDGRPEVVLGSDEGLVYTARNDGSSPASWPARGPGWPLPAPTAADLDGDGRPDLVTLSAVGSIAAFDSRARLTAGFPLDLGTRAKTPSVMTDLDGDGYVDLIVAGEGGVQAFTTLRPYRPGGSWWPLPRHDSAGSGHVAAAFPLRAVANAPTTISLSWDDPIGPMPPVRWRIERDDVVLGVVTQRAFDDTVQRAPEPHTYRIIGLDVAGNVAARSVDLRISATMAWCAGGEGRPCDDGDPCSANDLCRAGECRGGAAAADGAACDDANACTTGERCVAGACRPSEVRTCDAGGAACVSETCDPDTGACVARPLGDGTSCDDGNPCTTRDVCTQGRCASSLFATDETSCSDGNICTRDGVCHSGRCDGVFPFADGTICATADICAGSGTCVNGYCEDVRPLLDGTPCEDADLCTTGDLCQGGQCRSGSARACDAPGTCASASACNPRTGDCTTRPQPDYAPCDDGSACTRWDVCVDGRCTGEAPVLCSSDDDSCDPAAGICVAPVDIVVPEGCACAASGESADLSGAAWLALALGGLAWRRRALRRA